MGSAHGHGVHAGSLQCVADGKELLFAGDLSCGIQAGSFEQAVVDIDAHIVIIPWDRILCAVVECAVPDGSGIILALYAGSSSDFGDIGEHVAAAEVRNVGHVHQHDVGAVVRIEGRFKLGENFGPADGVEVDLDGALRCVERIDHALHGVQVCTGQAGPEGQLNSVAGRFGRGCGLCGVARAVGLCRRGRRFLAAACRHGNNQQRAEQNCEKSLCGFHCFPPYIVSCFIITRGSALLNMSRVFLIFSPTVFRVFLIFQNLKRFKSYF